MRLLALLVATTAALPASAVKPASAGPFAPGSTVLVSESVDGSAAGASDYAALSSDGRLVAFESSAPNLVAGDTNDARDAFVRDVSTGVIERVSVATSGEQADRASTRPVISGSGRFVAFLSRATNLGSAGGDAVYLRDRAAGTTMLVTTIQRRRGDPAISSDGTTVAWYDGGYRVWDRATGQTMLVCACPLGFSNDPSLSGDGSLIAFSTRLALVAEDLDPTEDAYVVDIATGHAELISSALREPALTDAAFAPKISDDGRWVVYMAFPVIQVHPVNLHLYDRATGTTTLVTRGAEPYDEPGIAADGRRVVYTSPGAILGAAAETVGGVHVWDRDTRRLTLVSLTDEDEPVVFVSQRDPSFITLCPLDPVCVPVVTNPGVSAGVWGGSNPVISADGRYAAFDSRGPFDPADTNGTSDVYLRSLE